MSYLLLHGRVLACAPTALTRSMPTVTSVAKRLVLASMFTLAALLGPARGAEPPRIALAPGMLPEDIKGTLVIVGGGPLPDAIMQRFLDLAGGQSAHLVVIPTASEKADTPEQLFGWPRWKAQRVSSLDLLHTRKAAVANDPAFVKPLSNATAVWLCGGDQSRLMSAYHNTVVERELYTLLRRGGVIGGTSAGAAVMSQLMICGGNPMAELGSGFGFLPGVVIDQHFQNRHRLDRLLGVLAKFPICPGIGIDEQTAVVVHGHLMSVLGNGNVRVCLSAAGKQQASVQVLKSGEQVDLFALCKTARARMQSPAIASNGSLPEEPLPPPMKLTARPGR